MAWIRRWRSEWLGDGDGTGLSGLCRGIDRRDWCLFGRHAYQVTVLWRSIPTEKSFRKKFKRVSKERCTELSGA